MLERKARLLAVLVIFSTVTIFIVALLQMRSAGRVDEGRLDWRDSVISQTVGFERQFLMFRGELATLLSVRAPVIATAKVNLRYELLVSRITLLRTSASLHSLTDRPEHSALLTALASLVERGDKLMAQPTVSYADAAALLAQMDALLPDVQSYTVAASAVTSLLIEEQYKAIHAQMLAIAALAALQLLLVGVSVYALWTQGARQRRQLAILTEELQEAKVAAEAASRTKSQFLANMSHELRTPFQGVLGMLQILERTPLTSTQSELIQTVHESASHLLVVLNEILDISAIEAGRIVLHEAPLELPRLCREVESLMRVQAEARGLDLRFECAAGVPDWVSGDSTRLKQILFNLLSNAIKFTPDGSVQMALRCRTGPDGRIHAVFEVRDTGIGMDDETIDRLFRRFEPGDTELSRRFSGTGLGLEISRTLARLMGGDVTAASQLGAGSCFVLSVPLTLAAAPTLAPEPQRQAARQRLRVLVADDHPINRRYIGMVLGSLGHEATLCANGEEALTAARATSFDVILMDVHMPVMDGLAATRAIRALGGWHKAMPILALSADVMTNARVQALEAGVTAFLAKPMGIDEIGAALGSITSDRARPGAPAEPPARCLSSRYEELAAKLPHAQLRDLAMEFFADEAMAYAQLVEALAGGSHPEVKQAAHKFKGSACMFGFARLTGAAEEAEAWAREQGTPQQAAHCAKALARAWDETRQELIQQLARAPGASQPLLTEPA